MTITSEEVDPKRARYEERRKRERANRIWTNVKPHIHPVIEEMAEVERRTKNAMVRVLVIEALEARGVDINKVYREWKATQGVEQGD